MLLKKTRVYLAHRCSIILFKKKDASVPEMFVAEIKHYHSKIQCGGFSWCNVRGKGAFGTNIASF